MGNEIGRHWVFAALWGMVALSILQRLLLPRRPDSASTQYADRFRVGRFWEAYIAARFIEEGLAVQVERLRIAPTREDVPEYKDKRDLYVEGREFEVKS